MAVHFQTQEGKNVPFLIFSYFKKREKKGGRGLYDKSQPHLRFLVPQRRGQKLVQERWGHDAWAGKLPLVGSPGACLPALSLTHPLARSLFTAGVHANFSTTIPPTSWQADLPPHHPSSACSDGTLKLSTAASTEGTGYGGRTGRGRKGSAHGDRKCSRLLLRHQTRQPGGI